MALTMKLAGASPTPAVTGEARQQGQLRYVNGNDPKKRRANIASYARVKCRDVYPNVDLVYYGNQRRLEYDFIVKPGGDPTRIELGMMAAGSASILKPLGKSGFDPKTRPLY